jgi:hypothetical protein
MWLADTAKYAVPHGFQYRTYARQAWVRLQDLNDVSAVADRYRLRKGKRRRNLHDRTICQCGPSSISARTPVPSSRSTAPQRRSAPRAAVFWTVVSATTR